jgi:putative oxidoreductase
MNTLQKIDVWAQTHHPFWIDYLRIPFGAILVAKGLFFIYNSTELVQVTQQYHVGNAYLLACFISWAHIIGGLFISLGLLTRLAVITQLPILFGAVFFINTHLDRMSGNGELLLSIIMLLLLICYLIEGPGEFSIDALISGKTWTIKDNIVRGKIVK